MEQFKGKTLSWKAADRCLELALHREPLNEIGTETLNELEQFAAALEQLGQGRAGADSAGAIIIHSEINGGFCAGADLRELYRHSQEVNEPERSAGVRDFLERIHRVLNVIDASPTPTIAAVQGVTFRGGFELALACDLIIADKTARFCFPELRLGLVPGFGGIPRLKRDIGNAVVRDLLFTGRSINAAKAQAVGLVSQVAGEGEALRVARATASQLKKFDRATAAAAKRFVKPIPHEELRREIDLFCELFARPAVEAGLRKFVESTEALPYLP
jgi:enoyl-CoA hydratase/carnithine racemase